MNATSITLVTTANTTVPTVTDSVVVAKHSGIRENKEKFAHLDMLYVVLVYTVLEDKGFRFNNPCVGVLLRNNLVLTTLSCLKVSIHDDIDTNLIYILIGDNEVLRPQTVYVYPGRKREPNVVLMLCGNSEVEEFPDLPEKEFHLEDFEYCTICGFGSGTKSFNLENFKALKINRTEMEMCNRESKGSDFICLHFKNVMPCRGDVGAPLLCDGIVHAIFNPPVPPWSPPLCLDSYGATFTTLHSLVPWINRVNESLHPGGTIFSSWWYWLGVVTISVTAMVALYLGVMRLTDWMIAKEEIQRREFSRVIMVRSSQMSRVSFRWLSTKQ